MSDPLPKDEVCKTCSGHGSFSVRGIDYKCKQCATENYELNAGGTRLEQSASGCDDGHGDSALTPGGAGGRRAPSNPISADLTADLGNIPAALRELAEDVRFGLFRKRTYADGSHDTVVMFNSKFADVLDEAARRLSVEPQGWQPIETAPKDGTHILAADFSVRGKFGTSPSRGIQDWYDVVHWFVDGWYSSTYGEDQTQPFDWISHWQPLRPLGVSVSPETENVLEDYDQAAVGMGYMAFEANKHLDANPWRDDTRLGRSWIHGWFDASDKKRPTSNTAGKP